MAEKWRIKEICKSCYYRRLFVNDACVRRDYSNTMCAYTLETNKFRQKPPTDEHCECYRPRTKKRGGFKF